VIDFVYHPIIVIILRSTLNHGLSCISQCIFLFVQHVLDDLDNTQKLSPVRGMQNLLAFAWLGDARLDTRKPALSRELQTTSHRGSGRAEAVQKPMSSGSGMKLHWRRQLYRTTAAWTRANSPGSEDPRPCRQGCADGRAIPGRARSAQALPPR
jgi:hypothetical protein